MLQALVAVGGTGFLSAPAQGLSESEASITDPHTRATFRAAVDAVVPRTPELRTLGIEHVPGGLSAGVDEYIITYVNDLFSLGLPTLGSLSDLRLAEILSAVLDLGAVKLIALGGNESAPKLSRALALLDLDGLVDPTDALAEGPFAKLSRQDRLRALAVFDDIEFDTAELPGPLIEGDGGLVAQLMVAFTELIYYSEWQGYTDITAPPSERDFTNDPSAVQSWRQTDFPGVADGHAAFRGYWGTPDGSLGRGTTWQSIEAVERPLEITFKSGQFRENDYDTGDYEEIHPERGRSDGDLFLSAAPDAVTGDAGADKNDDIHREVR